MMIEGMTIDSYWMDWLVFRRQRQQNGVTTATTS